jgi:hypothetical protein
LDYQGDICGRDHQLFRRLAQTNTVAAVIKQSQKIETREREGKAISQTPAYLIFDYGCANNQSQPDTQFQLTTRNEFYRTTSA